ncbi:MAG: dihydroorotase [Lachnospiraceae bacterium]
MGILITGGRILDPHSGRDEIGDIYIEEGLIQNEEAAKAGETIEKIDAAGCFVMPGLIDLHVHLRDPGYEYKEDIISGARAAAKGGFTTVVAMPNTNPPIDTPDKVKYVTNKAKQMSDICILQAGAVTMKQAGQELADIEGMIAAGIPAITEDGKSVMNLKLYKEAMEIAARADIPVMAHCEDRELACDGCMHESDKSRELGLQGITNATEDVIVARDIILAKETGARLHLCHCSTKGSVKLIQKGKEEGVRVSGEVCPHHFTLTSEDIPADDANYKMNPPLRSREDVEALLAGLKDGTIEVISTDHAPHSEKEKRTSMKEAPFGIVGLETSVSLTISELVDKGIITPLEMAEKMSYNPSRILNIARGTLAEGAIADVTIIDPKAAYTIDKNKFVSKGKNTPFHGRPVKGRVLYTICEGKVVYQYQDKE